MRLKAPQAALEATVPFLRYGVPEMTKPEPQLIALLL